MLLEGLETRNLLAFAITSSGNSITLTGDASDDSVVISISGSGHFQHNLPLEGNLVSDIDTDADLEGEQSILASDASIAIFSNNGNDTIDASAWSGAGVSIFGGYGDDLIIGGSGDDHLVGDDWMSSWGNDQIFGGDGNDTLVASSGSGAYSGGEGYDWVVVSAQGAMDVLVTDSQLTFNGVESSHDSIEDFQILGTPGDDVIDASALTGARLFAQIDTGNDIVRGGAFDDVIFVSDGFKTIEGANGHDEIVVQGFSQVFIENDTFQLGGIASTHHSIDMFTINGTGGDDTIDASAWTNGYIVVNSGHGNDWIHGGALNDVLHGNEGNDTLFGGPGDDHLYGDESTGSFGNDFVDGGGGSDTIFVDGGSDVLWGGDGWDNVNHLNVSNVTITDTLYMADGVQFSHQGMELFDIYGTSGNDTIDASALSYGSIFAVGRDGDDIIRGGAGDDQIYGYDPWDQHADNDILEGGAGDDELWGGSGIDQFDGGTGIDLVVVPPSNHVIVTNTHLQLGGVEFAHTNVERFYITGTSGNDIIDASTWTGGRIWAYGYGGDDWIHGGSGGDVLSGYDPLSNEGNDVLIGGGGYDYLDGQLGNDRLDIMDASFRTARGNAGYDILTFGAANIHLDLVADQDDKVLGVEEIDISGTGSNSLTINQYRVLSISDSDTLIVRGDRDDTVNKGDGWIFAGTEMIAEVPYKVYTQAAAILKLSLLADIELDPAVVPENVGIDTEVGSFRTIDLDPSITFTYSLVSGVGDTDNNTFSIDGNKLRLKANLDYETKTSYSIRVRSTDQDGLTKEEVLTVSVTDVNESPLLTRGQASLIGNVLSGFTNNGTWSDPEGNPVILSASIGTVVKNNDGTWSWSFIPSQAYTNQLVTITGIDSQGLSSQVQFTIDALVAVVNSKVYYTRSSFAGTSVDAALDTSKVLAKPGATSQKLGFANLINTTRGINGLVFDVAGLAAASLTASDFVFRMSPTGNFNEGANPPSAWDATPAPTLIHVTPGTATTAARLRLEWADNAIANRWLQIKVLNNTNTGLIAPEVCYIGHLFGETNGGETNNAFFVQNSDLVLVREKVGSPAPVSSAVDLDRNGLHQNADIVAIRPRVGVGSLRVITIPPAGSGGEGEGRRFGSSSLAAPDVERPKAGSTSVELSSGLDRISTRLTDQVFDVPLPPAMLTAVASKHAAPRISGAFDKDSAEEESSSLLSLDQYFERIGKDLR